MAAAAATATSPTPIATFPTLSLPRRSQSAFDKRPTLTASRSTAFSRASPSPAPRSDIRSLRPLSPLVSRSFLNWQEDAEARRLPALRSAGTDSDALGSLAFPGALRILHLALSLGIILTADKLLKKAFVAASIKFPSALFGMFCVFSVLTALDYAAPSAAKGVMDFFEPATTFIQRWLPLFYVPSLVVLPLAVRDVPAASGLKIFVILVGGWLASLSVAGQTAITVRKLVKTEMIPAEPMPKASPFSNVELWTWASIFLSTFVLAYVNPTALGTSARTCLPFLLAATVLGYMVGSGLPFNVKKVFHPIICCALSADLAAVTYGYFSKSSLDAVLADYLTKMSSNPGAGDILMGFLGSVIISFAFSMFKQRKLVKRHAAEIFSSVIFATIFSLYSTAIIGRLVGLEPNLTISILPRCITVALALSIVSFFEGANPSLTAAAVVLTGVVGANFVQTVMDKLRLDDPIARGIATASSAHGLGTAALSAKEPEALPFCAIAYALTGICGSLICSVPIVRQSLLFIVG
ncbi:plastidal glycolate/glycerate translocator 1, chloroplastic-like [Zingiber officinale]|uniref:plastidal glycolate/glycerate translocator 1, chloroplastic-like n=2 Tax=Zingiber officinale TaxID=94328 RepID=UPI001C4D9D1B|nr:plastidal glycolate/glycerate translocator 1, chloroplastic-like [Zingiber officinale]